MPAQDRFERLRQRHDAVPLDDAGRALARRDELLTTPRHARAVAEDLRRWVDSTERVRGAPVVRFRLRRRAKVDLRQAASDVRAVPNTLYSGEPEYDGGPASPPTQPKRTPQPPRNNGTSARTPTVSVLDTGISAHPWFVHQPWFAACGPRDAEVLDADLDFELDRQSGHGTFVTGVVLRRSPGACIRAQRVLSSDGVCDEAVLVAALARCAKRTTDSSHVDVVNLSLGGYTYDDQPSPVLAAALHDLDPRTVVVAAAGNHGSSRPFWPAAMKGVIGVGALDAAGAGPAEFSNRGWWVDACAPGVGVTSSFVWFNGPRTGRGRDDPDHFLGFATWSGTSFATATVSGAVAAQCAKQGVDAQTAVRELLDPDRRRRVAGLGLVVVEPRQRRNGRR